MNIVLGLDFDNTLVSYDDVIYQMAMRKGWLLEGQANGKKDIRDHLRELPEGDIKWQEIQAYIYGEGMTQAVMMPGACEVIRNMRKSGVSLFVVSHKTEFASMDKHNISLRQTALSWMTGNGFFEKHDLGFNPDEVFFESTRENKIRRIKSLGCTHFVDDLEETFKERSFPRDVFKFLFDPQGLYQAFDDVCIVQTWSELDEAFRAQNIKSELIES